jgi:molybdopterin synthase catalytic subunit
MGNPCSARPSHGPVHYDWPVIEPPDPQLGHRRRAGQVQDWIALTREPLTSTEVTEWVTTPASGAVVVFSGVVRDHSDDRAGVTGLTYEAYEHEVERRLREVAGETRRRWPGVERLALLHRTGAMSLSETSVIVAVSTPHRGEAFDAARFAIDTLKETVPIWKREHWAEGSDWAEGSHAVRAVREPDPA